MSQRAKNLPCKMNQVWLRRTHVKAACMWQPVDIPEQKTENLQGKLTSRTSQKSDFLIQEETQPQHIR